MPAVSQQQQKIMGLALSVKRGETPESEVSDDVLKIVNSMSQDELEKYAGTEHTGLPQKVEQKLRETIREILKTENSNITHIAYSTKGNMFKKTKIAEFKSERAAKMWISKNSDKYFSSGYDSIGFMPIGEWNKQSKPFHNESVNEAKSYSNKFASWFTGTVLNTVKHPTQGKHQLTADQIQKSPADYKNKLFKVIEKAIKNGDISSADIKKNESVKESSNKNIPVISKANWDRAHKDYKSIRNGQHYMMYLDKKTGGTIYGPVTIKESVKEAIETKMTKRGNDIFVDTNFVQASNKFGDLVHLGMGEFMVKTKDGNVDFVRVNKQINGFTGRTHKLDGNKTAILNLVKKIKPKLVKESVKESANASIGSIVKSLKSKIKEIKLTENKFRKGDLVRVIDRPKYVWDKQFYGKSGYVKDVIGRDILVTFPNDRTILINPKDLEINPK